MPFRAVYRFHSDPIWRTQSKCGTTTDQECFLSLLSARFRSPIKIELLFQLVVTSQSKYYYAVKTGAGRQTKTNHLQLGLLPNDDFGGDLCTLLFALYKKVIQTLKAAVVLLVDGGIQNFQTMP